MGRLRFRARHVVSVLIGAALIGAVGACGSESKDRDVVAGKQQFVKNCGAFHPLPSLHFGPSITVGKPLPSESAHEMPAAARPHTSTFPSPSMSA